MTIATPRFGGCLDSNTAQIDFCALSPKDCAANGNGIYVKPDEISQNRCSSASQVEVGRCDSSLDDNLCTYSKTSCQISSKHARDGTCNVIKDSSADSMTRYPYCRVLPEFDPNEPFRCVLSADDCTEKEMAIPITTFAKKDPCYCHHVPTGICYLSTAAKITADSSFCAVEQYDCPEAYRFMSAHQLLNMETPPRYCRLCQQGMSKVQLHEQVVEAGGCFKNLNFMRCALQFTDCSLTNNEIFKSSPEMREMGFVPCPAWEMKGGECTSSMEDIACTNTADSCLLPQKFVSDNSCTMHSDVRTGLPAGFGHCQNSKSIKNSNWENYRCVWQESECDVLNELWYPASGQKDWFRGCKCEDVVTGGCTYNGEVHCAVSERACADPSTFRNAKQLEDDGILCHLCHPKVRVKVIDNIVEVMVPDQSPISTSTGTGRHVNMGWAIGGGIGGALVLTGAATFFYMRNRKRNIGE